MVIDGNKILKQISDVKEIILERAKTYTDLSEIHLSDLYDVDMDKGIVVDYDQQDRENHAHDLGKLYILENLITNE